jgi:hypothetical protein
MGQELEQKTHSRDKFYPPYWISISQTLIPMRYMVPWLLGWMVLTVPSLAKAPLEGINGFGLENNTIRLEVHLIYPYEATCLPHVIIIGGGVSKEQRSRALSMHVPGPEIIGNNCE